MKQFYFFIYFYYYYFLINKTRTKLTLLLICGGQNTFTFRTIVSIETKVSIIQRMKITLSGKLSISI